MIQNEDWTLPAMFGVAVAILAVVILMSNTATALSISVSPTFSTIDINMTLNFTNSTAGLNASQPISYYYTLSSYNGITQMGNSFLFQKAGNYSIAESVTNSNYSISSNAVVMVAPALAITINPRFPEAVYGQHIALQAIATGGTSPYTYQWSNATNTIQNGTSPFYTTNALSQAETYYVTVNDIYNRTATATVTVAVGQSLYTSEGEYVGSFGTNGNYTVLAPSFMSIPNGVEALNVTPYATMAITACNESYQVYETGMTPDYVNLSIANIDYNLYPGQPQLYGADCEVELVNVSWAPIIQTSTLEFYYQQPPTTTSTSITTSSTSSVSTTAVSTSATTTVAPTTTSIAQKSPISAPIAIPWGLIGYGTGLLVVIIVIVRYLQVFG